MRDVGRGATGRGARERRASVWVLLVRKGRGGSSRIRGHVERNVKMRKRRAFRKGPTARDRHRAEGRGRSYEPHVGHATFPQMIQLHFPPSPRQTSKSGILRSQHNTPSSHTWCFAINPIYHCKHHAIIISRSSLAPKNWLVGVFRHPYRAVYSRHTAVLSPGKAGGTTPTPTPTPDTDNGNNIATGSSHPSRGGTI